MPRTSKASLISPAELTSSALPAAHTIAEHRGVRPNRRHRSAAVTYEAKAAPPAKADELLADGILSTSTATDGEPAARPVSKTASLLALLLREEGATIAELCEATGWQPHSVRGAMAGTLRKKGHVVTSAKLVGMRRYRIERAVS